MVVGCAALPRLPVFSTQFGVGSIKTCHLPVTNFCTTFLEHESSFLSRSWRALRYTSCGRRLTITTIRHHVYWSQNKKIARLGFLSNHPCNEFLHHFSRSSVIRQAVFGRRGSGYTQSLVIKLLSGCRMCMLGIRAHGSMQNRLYWTCVTCFDHIKWKLGRWLKSTHCGLPNVWKRF